MKQRVIADQMGRLVYEAVLSRDFPLILALTGLSAIFVVAGNLLADLLYLKADPRIRLS